MDIPLNAARRRNNLSGYLGANQLDAPAVENDLSTLVLS